MTAGRSIGPLAAIVVFWAVSLANLEVFPPMRQDEPWIAATPYKLATQGVFGSDLFAGYYGLEHHDFRHMPVYPLALAAMFKTAGAGVFQMRFLPVACGLLVLPLSFAVGRQMRGDRAGLLAMALLLGQRLTIGRNETGIPLLDISRVGRYDIAVPVFGLAALWTFNRAERHAGPSSLYLASGALAGLAGLTHLYGAFWLPVLLGVLLLRCGLPLARERAPYLLVAGFVIPWLPWAAFIATGGADCAGQMRYAAARFDLLNPQFYLQNLLDEPKRWPLALWDETGKFTPGCIGAWATIAGLPIALGLALARGYAARREGSSREAFALAFAALGQGMLFALLLHIKNYNYAIALWPLAVLILAWLAAGVWGWKRSLWGRVVVLILLALILAEGGVRIAHREEAAAHTTSYEQFEAQVASYIPAGSRVLGLHNYWLGLRQFQYITWLVPFLYVDPRFYDEPLTMRQALERVDPDVILIDPNMDEAFAAMADPTHERHWIYTEFREYLERRQAVLAGTVTDLTYGAMRIYLLSPTRPAGGGSGG